MSDPNENLDAIRAARHALLALDKEDASYAILSALEQHPKCKAIFRRLRRNEYAIRTNNRKLRSGQPAPDLHYVD